MKKFVTSILVAVLLLSLFAVQIFAAEDSVSVSIKGAKGKPGDIVEVQLYMDENPGLWACGFDVSYNASYFQLGDVENGEVFSDAAFVKSPITPTGSYRFYAQYNNVNESTDKTGVLATLYFKILETAPNGSHSVSINLIRGGEGWFVKVGPDSEPMDLTITAGEAATITVSESSATAPVTDATTDSSETSDKSEDTTGRPVTQHVTDEDSYAVTDKNGKYVTEVVTEVVTDSEGNIVYDDAGNPVTEIVTETIAVTESTTTTDNDEDDAQENVGMKKIILIVGLILLVVAAAIILVILYNARKNGKGPGSGDDAAAPEAVDSPDTSTNDQDQE